MKFVLQYLRNAQKIYTSGVFVPKDAKPENVVRANLTESISLLDDTASFFCALTETKQAIAQGKDVRGAQIMVLFTMSLQDVLQRLERAWI